MLILVKIKFARESTQVFSPFGQVPSPSQSKLSDVDELSNKIQDNSALKWISMRLASTWEESYGSVWPPNASLDASTTYGYLRLLASLFGQDLTIST